MLIKVAIAAIGMLIVLYAFHECMEPDYQPSRRHRIILFVTGAISTFFISWATIPEPILFMFWFKALVSLMAGYHWAYIAPERMQTAIKRSQTKR